MQGESYAVLHQVQLKIERLFFSNSTFSFTPPSDSPGKELLNPSNVLFSSEIKMLNETEKSLQVTVQIQTDPNASKYTNFSVCCIGIYAWLGNDLDSDLYKSIYSWAVAVQTGAIRQHVVQETSRGPFGTPYFIPVALVEIKDRQTVPVLSTREKEESKQKH